jgi:hypothetical protein
MLYRAKSNGDEGVKGCKVIGWSIPFGYEFVKGYFVDSSGFGQEEEVALTFGQFLKEVKQGYFYGIREVGQFQVKIGEFKKVSRAKTLKEQGIVSSKLISKSCRVINYLNGNKTIRLYSTDIVQFKGNKIILSSGGYKTHTTKARINQFINDFHFWLYQKDYKWYIDYGKNKKEFFDGIELDA